MSKTITMKDVIKNPVRAVSKAEVLAREMARAQVINAKRRMCGRAQAWVDGQLRDGGVDARSDLVR